MIAHNLLQSVRLMAEVTERLALRLVDGITVNAEQLAKNVAGAILPATALNPVLGYDVVARITERALADGTTPREAAIALKLMAGEDYDRHVDPAALANPAARP